MPGLPDVTPEERLAYTTRLADAKATDCPPERFARVKAVIVTADPSLTPDQVEALA